MIGQKTSLQVANALLNPIFLWAAGMALWFSQFITVTEYYERTQQLGWYPANADNIVIPIATQGAAALLFAPVFALILWMLVRHTSRANRHWFVWHNVRFIGQRIFPPNHGAAGDPERRRESAVYLFMLSKWEALDRRHRILKVVGTRIHTEEN